MTTADLPDASSAEVEDKGETDAARLQRLMAERTDTFSPVHLKNEDAEWLFSLARRAALVPDAEVVLEDDAAFVERLEKFAPMVGQPQLMQVMAAEWMRVVALARRAAASAESVAWHPDQDREWQQAKCIADVVLDRPNADPDDDIAVLARQLLRKAERIEAAPPTAPAPASPAGGEVGEAEVEAAHKEWATRYGVDPKRPHEGLNISREAIRHLLQAATCVRAASSNGEGWRSTSTAPRDGSEFLAAQDGEIYQCRWHEEECDGGYAPSKGWYDLVGRSFEQPTHWRPLPPPPGAQPDPAPAVAATSPDIIAVARAEERDYLRNEIVSLCEDTEQRYADVAERDTEGKQGAFSRGRIVEAKSIRKAICEVIRIRALTPIPSTDATGGTTTEPSTYDWWLTEEQARELGFTEAEVDAAKARTALRSDQGGR